MTKDRAEDNFLNLALDTPAYLPTWSQRKYAVSHSTVASTRPKYIRVKKLQLFTKGQKNLVSVED